MKEAYGYEPRLGDSEPTITVVGIVVAIVVAVIMLCISVLLTSL